MNKKDKSREDSHRIKFVKTDVGDVHGSNPKLPTFQKPPPPPPPDKKES